MQSPANLRAVRECFPALMVAVVSASKSRRDVLQALEAGVHGYIPKGMGVGGLTSALRSLLAGMIYVPSFLAEIGGSVEDSSVAHPPSTSASSGLIDMLTPRQQEVLELIVQGKSNKEIARALRLGEGTVKVHMAALFRALGVNTRSAAAAAGAKALGQG
jgi:DNA-binding NarL/FixJ family response regulator